MRLLGLAAGLAVLLPAALAAQLGSTTDIITGVVRNSDNQPVANARIEVLSVETGTTRVRTTNEKGQYIVLFPDGGSGYRVTARAIGSQPATVALHRLADEDRLVADFRLAPAVSVLSSVVITGRQTPHPNDSTSTPGSSEYTVTGDQLLRLPVDASDPTAVASLVAGVIGVPETDSSAGGFSIAGQRVDQNRVTLDGLSFGGRVPAEALRVMRVITSTFDVARGQFTGGQVASTTRSGTNELSGSFAYALHDPRLEYATGDNGSTFSGAFTQHQLSGGLGGPIVRNKAFWFASLQLRRRLDVLQSLLGAGTRTLQALSIQPDSAARFLALLGRYGLPAHNSLVPDDRTTDNLAGIVRLDQQLNESHSLSIRGSMEGSRLNGFRTTPQSVPTHAGKQAGSSSGGLVSLSSVAGQLLNEFKASYAIDTRGADPYILLPDGRVYVTSRLANGQVGRAALEFGGNGALPNNTMSSTLEATNETSWLSHGGQHRWKLGALVLRSGFRTAAGSNRSGTFQFMSLSDLDANRPSQFTRSFAPAERTGGALSGALYFGDTWRANRAFQLSYGVRVEGGGIDGQPPFNPDVYQKFDVRTNGIPWDVRVSPRVGFSIMLGLPADTGRGGNSPAAPRGGGQGAQGSAQGRIRSQTLGAHQPPPQIPQPWIIRGGIGEFRGREPTQLFSSAIDATGLSNGELQLVCVGAAVPTPNWQGYLSNPNAIPAACADGSGAAGPLSTSRPNVTTFSRGFAAPRSIRGSLGVSKRFHQWYTVSLDASYTRGVSLYGVSDLNLLPTPKFSLASEGNRPVYVPANTIVASTGATTVAASRRDRSYGYVFLVSSPLTSHTAQMTATVNGTTFRQLMWNVAYAFMRSTDQSSFSGGNALGGFSSPTTAGNPGALPTRASDLQRRHAVNGSLTWIAKPWLDVTAVLRTQSGQPYTPRVAGDINGDGARNDRAYVYDPAQAPDTALANGMRRLLATAPAAARRCLMSQLKRVAERNSCVAPWTAALDLQLNWRPHLGATLQRRLQVQAGLLNPLAGLDQVLHGDAHLRGWGQPTFVDPALLYVRGFNTAANRFLYTVNERFGSNALARSGLRNPVQLSLAVRYQVGVDRQRQLLEGMLKTGSSRAVIKPAADVRSMIERLSPDPLAPLMDLKDKLQLTSEQVATLRVISASLSAKTDVLVKRAEAQMRMRDDGGADLSARSAKLQPILQEARSNAVATAQAVRNMLTPAQWADVPESVRHPMLQPKDGSPATNGAARPPSRP